MATDRHTEPILSTDSAAREPANFSSEQERVGESIAASGTSGWDRTALNRFGLGASVVVHLLLVLWAVGLLTPAQKLSPEKVVSVSLVEPETAPPPPPLEVAPRDIKAPVPLTPQSDRPATSPANSVESINPAEASSSSPKENAEFLELLASYGIIVSDKPTTLPKEELSALSAQAKRCWKIPAGWTNPSQVSVTVRFRLNRDGTVNGTPTVVEFPASELGKAAAVDAIRAVLECDPFELPGDKYDQWNEVQLRFEP